MIKKLLRFIPVFFLVLSSCNQVPNELLLAEQVMETRPDSALHILQKIGPASYKSPSHRALYGLLYFEALDKKDKPLEPDSLIDFSINHYLAKNENLNLAKSYFFKARMYRKRKHFEDAIKLHLNALDLLKSTNNYNLLGQIYSDMSDICFIQKELNGSLNKNWLAVKCFNKAGNKLEANYRTVSIGKIYRFRKDYRRAQNVFKSIISTNSDSLLLGFAFQEQGINYYWAKQNDSAQYYLRKSIQFPYKDTNYAVRCFYLADLLYNITQYDSACSYAQLALKYPSTFFNQRDCYRILANSEYHRENFKEMSFYISKYQESVDSVRTTEIQSKASILENLHNNNQETAGTKRRMIWTVSVLALVLLFSAIIVYLLIQRNNLRKTQLSIYKQELNHKQEFVTQNLSGKIAETREAQSEARRNASPEERTRLDKELYQKCLHLDNWDAFSREMNHAFNQIVDVLQSDYSGITHKEIIWCCLHLLDIPNADRTLLLNATPDSMYKLKQRLAQKMNLKSTKELDSFLKVHVSHKV